VKKHNICQQCALATDSCEKQGRECFYAEDRENELLCPYCGYLIDDGYELSQLGMYKDRNTDYTFNCDKCGNAMNVNSYPKWIISARPADESAVERLGHSDYRDE